MNSLKIKKTKANQGFTLAELMIATVVLVVAFVGVMVSFLKCMELNELSRNTSQALFAAKTRMEQIKDTDFANIFATYDQVTFTPANLNGIGVSYIDNTDPNFLIITVTVSWQQKNGRVIGEDLDLDGVRDSGEDINGNNMLDSPVQLVTSIFNE